MFYLYIRVVGREESSSWLQQSVISACGNRILWFLLPLCSFGSWFHMSQSMASWPDAFGRMVFWRTHLQGGEQQWKRQEGTWVPLGPSKAAPTMVQIISTKLLPLTPAYSTNSLQFYGVGTQPSSAQAFGGRSGLKTKHHHPYPCHKIFLGTHSFLHRADLYHWNCWVKGTQTNF